MAKSILFHVVRLFHVIGNNGQIENVWVKTDNGPPTTIYVDFKYHKAQLVFPAFFFVKKKILKTKTF